MSDPRRLHLVIHGQVQGVAFRAYTMGEARRLQLDGWVRNQPDGTVEVLAEGPAESLSRLETWCHQGSPAAAVHDVEVQWLEFKGDLSPFSIRYR